MKFVKVLPMLLLSVLAGLSPSPAKDGTNAGLAPRTDILLGTGWRFLQADVQGAPAPDFDDAAWKSVEVPHCWNIVPGQNGDKENFYEGPGWYRLHLKPDASLAGKSLFLKFDGAYHAAEVFINGSSVGSHVGGFAAFCFDVTEALRPGQDNVLAVKVSYTPPFPSIPLQGDFTRYPGLYREVHLLCLDQVSVSPLDHASSGVSLKQVTVDDAAAEIEATVRLRNGGKLARNVAVKLRILDLAGLEVQTVTSERAIPAGGEIDAVQSVTVRKPHLWNGRLDPYLYSAVIEVSDPSGLKDRVVQPLGLRHFRADPKEGFFLNGKRYAIHGVNRHQDHFDKGWVVSKAEMEQDLALLLEMGCTGVRLAHYQHADWFYQLCDRAGLVVWAELPLIGGGWIAKDIDDPDGKVGSVGGTDLKSRLFTENARQQLTELIKQNYNHPSIVFWGLWNEIGSPKSDSDKEFLSGLNSLAKQLDSNRLTTAANADTKNKTTEVVGRNTYYGWYNGTPEELKTQLPIIAASTNGRPFIISEYGAGASILQHQLKGSNVSPKGKWHPEEWQSLIHEKAWEALVTAPNLCATFAWLGFDCSTMLRNEGDHPGRNDKGLITADRSVRKDAFYFYKANWNPEPMVYISSRRFTPRPSGPSPIKIYSSCSEVELFINGKSQQLLNSAVNGVFAWENIALPEGDVSVEVVGRRDGKAVKDKCVWKCVAGAPANLGFPAKAAARSGPQ